MRPLSSKEPGTGAIPSPLPLAVLWAARLFVRGGVAARMLAPDEHIPRALVRFLALPASVTGAKSDALAFAALERHLTALESAPRDATSDVVFDNVARFGRLLGLDSVEREVVAFAALAEAEPGFKLIMAEVSGRLSDITRAASAALGRSVADVRKALHSSGTLRSARIVAINANPARFMAAFGLIDGLADVLVRESVRREGFLASVARSAPRSKLVRGDFDHARESVELLAGLLDGALRRRAKGVNVLIHGDPGTGKTELVRLLAQELRARLYEVGDEDWEGDGVEGIQRLGRCAVAQRMLASTRRTLLVFDEIEDAFPHRSWSMFGTDRRSTAQKAWTHRILEENRVPTIWIANHISQIDPATIRRFDLVLEMRKPPVAARRRMIERTLDARSFDPAWVDRIATDERVTAAHIDRAARVARLSSGNRARVGPLVARVLDANLAVLGEPRATIGGPPVSRYDLAYVNASEDLVRLASAIAERPRASICLYGPPGSGKTAFAVHLADRLGRPLRVERASDLQSMWVGETEKRIATAFRRARDEKAILFIDEADGFLQSRERAHAAWEVTQVNELLVQIEGFDGTLVCATNLMSTLDPAALRRFEIKVRFGAMTPEQRWAMFVALAPSADPVNVRRTLDRCDGLTPGDFAAVARRLRLLEGEVPPDRLLAGLENELALKPNARGRIVGFGVTT